MVIYRTFSELFENHIFMDDGATPVEHGGAPAPAHIPEFHDFSIALLCLMSALQHQNFQTFGISTSCINFRVVTSSPNFARILTSGSLKIAFFCARGANMGSTKNAKIR